MKELFDNLRKSKRGLSLSFFAFGVITLVAIFLLGPDEWRTQERGQFGDLIAGTIGVFLGFGALFLIADSHSEQVKATKSQLEASAMQAESNRLQFVESLEVRYRSLLEILDYTTELQQFWDQLLPVLENLKTMYNDHQIHEDIRELIDKVIYVVKESSIQNVIARFEEFDNIIQSVEKLNEGGTSAFLKKITRMELDEELLSLSKCAITWFRNDELADSSALAGVHFYVYSFLQQSFPFIDFRINNVVSSNLNDFLLKCDGELTDCILKKIEIDEPSFSTSWNDIPLKNLALKPDSYLDQICMSSLFAGNSLNVKFTIRYQNSDWILNKLPTGRQADYGIYQLNLSYT